MKLQTFLALCLLAIAPVAHTQLAEHSAPATTVATILEPLVTEGVVDAPLAEIWRVFSTADGYKKLGVAKAEMDFRPGGLIKTSYDPAQPLDGDGAIQTEVLAYEPLRFVATRIHKPPKGFPFKDAWRDIWTVVSLTALDGGRTDVRLAMMGWRPDPESQAMREFFRTGNDWVLEKLQSNYSASPAPSRPAHAEDPLAPVDVQVVVEADRSRVWRSFTTAAGWHAFFGVDATIGARPGEPFEILFAPAAPAGQRGAEGCTLLSLVPNEMISFTWNAPPKFPFMRAQHTWVVVTFEALSPATTRVRLRELGFAGLAADHPEHLQEVEKVRAYFANAWPKVLGALAAHLTG